MALSFRHLILLLAQCTFLYTTLAIPVHETYVPYDPYNGTTYSLGHSELDSLIPRQSGDKPLLRLMPLGASITRGSNSNPVNGYRKALRDELRYLGYPVNMVGCMAEGDFKDNQHEGHPGQVISAVKQSLECSIGQKPNIVLINAGTNDCLGGIDIPGVPSRMADIIDRLFSQIDGVTVLLSTLLVNGDARANANVEIVNEGYRRLVKDMAGQGRKIALAEMNNGFITLADISTVDVTHPTNDGYRKLASVWTAAFKQVATKGWITEPVEIDGPDDAGNDCQPSSSNFRGPIRSQNGMQPAYNDGEYDHKGTLMGNVTAALWIVKKGQDSIIKQFHFAQLVNTGGADRGGETDELIRILDPEQQEQGNSLPQVAYQENTNGRYSGAWITIDVGTPCNNRGVRWGDINGDGLDDFICLSYPDGAMSVSINNGGNPPTFTYIGLIRAAVAGILQEDIRLGDIDGDGRLDFCHIQNPGGNIFCFRNGGQSFAPTEQYGGYWEGMVGVPGEPTFNAKGMPGNVGVRLIDINGDFRADWVYVFPDGHTRIFINHRGTKADGAGLKPAWVEAKSAHLGFPGTDIDQDHVKFGRLYGTGRADYIWVKETATNVDKEVMYQYQFEVYRNDGAGGTKLRGDGARYCDMYGTGKDDFMYVFGDGSGKIELFENTGTPNVWNVRNGILNTGRERKSLHFGDWDGDGLCDVLAVDKKTGNVDMWRNTYKPGSSTVPTFAYQAGIVTGGRCTEGWGTGVFDLGLRFADIDGDGRVDYLCMDKTGRTTGYLNRKDEFFNIGQIKFSEGFDRANHRWADVNGDGKADFLWTNPRTGEVEVWLNGGNIPTGGSAFFWNKIEAAFPTGVDRGATLNFVKMSPSGRADLVNLLPESGIAYTYFNECPGAGSGKGPGPDDGAIVDPQLPAIPDGLPDRGDICPRTTTCGNFPDLARFIAMGDSYSAGIGAGNRIVDNRWDVAGRCLQGSNAHSRALFYQSPSLRNKEFEFLSCSGDKIENILTTKSGPKKDPRDKSQLEMLEQIPNTSFSVITLSMGGNNVKFSKIAQYCLLMGKGGDGPNACANLITIAQRAIGVGPWAGVWTPEKIALYADLRTMYRKLLQAPAAEDATLIVTGYARFFNDADQSGTPDQDCAKRSMSFIARASPAVGDYPPFLTLEIRRTVNEAVIGLNQLIKDSIDAVNNEDFAKESLRKGHYIDIDKNFDGYRWCDKDANGRIKSFKDESFMFLPFSTDIISDPTSGMPLPGRNDDTGPLLNRSYGAEDCNEDDLESMWTCFLDGVDKEDINQDLYPEAYATFEKRAELRKWGQYTLMKAFHPKSIVHLLTAADIEQSWKRWQQESECPCDV